MNMNDVDINMIQELQEKLNLIRNNGIVPSQQKTIADEIMIETSSMNMTEQVSLSEMQEFKEADKLYTNAFNSFLMNKFKAEFVSTDLGKQVATNLLETIRFCKETLLQKHKEEMEEFKLWKQQKENK